MPEALLNSTREPQPGQSQKLRRVARAIQIWIRQLIYSLIEIVILFTATAVLIGILLSFLEALWYIYLQTPVGIKYTTNPARTTTHVLTQLFQKDLFLFSLEIAVVALVACLTTSFVCQVLALHRYFYVGRGLINRIIWLMLFSAATGFELTHRCQVDLQVALGVAIVPNLCLFPACLKISARILPELTPFGIWKLLISLKHFLIHPAEKVRPDSHTANYEPGGGNLNPTAAGCRAPSTKASRARHLESNANTVISK